VRSSIWRHRVVDGREARARHRILVALGRLPHPFDQDANLTHVTGSALVIGNRGVLLHRHKRLGLWLQPGGHLEADETPWAAAHREAGEETGLGLAWPAVDASGVPPLAHLDVHPGGRDHTHLDLRYLLRPADGDEPAPATGESPDVRWFSWADAVAIADPGLVGFLRAHAPGQ
jgi:8-oxo-dGTP pyrophosphatase MutT (NUDIX family)